MYTAAGRFWQQKRGGRGQSQAERRVCCFMPRRAAALRPCSCRPDRIHPHCPLFVPPCNVHRGDKRRGEREEGREGSSAGKRAAQGGAEVGGRGCGKCALASEKVHAQGRQQAGGSLRARRRGTRTATLPAAYC